MTYSDEDLIAFLDGSADEATAVAILRDMESDTALEDRMLALDTAGPIVNQAFGHLQKPVEPFVAAVAKTQPHDTGWAKRLMPLAAAALVGAALGAAIAPFGTKEADWRERVADYQALYGPSTVANATYSAAELTTQNVNAGEAIGLAGLDGVVSLGDGLDHVRTQILQVDGQPLAQLVFRTKDGIPVALCGLPKDATSNAGGIDHSIMADMTSASFDTANHSWILIGSQDAELIKDNASRFKTAIEALEA